MSAEPLQHSTSPHEVYSVRERIAIGTAGLVYRAVQTATGRDVTFKALVPKSTHPLEPARVAALRWRLEALHHPVIAELLDAYEDPEGFIVVTSWLPGGMGGNDFPHKKRKLTKAEASHVAMQLCEALLVGEQQRFPHGDIKPSNVVLADRGPAGMAVQIQDWGLSACREAQPPETLQFWAPERHYGHPASLRGDLFSLAATLWYLLTAESPSYGHNRDEVLQDWGTFDSSTIAKLRPDLDHHFREWLTWLLRWQPEERPKSVSDAIGVLKQAISFAAAAEARGKQAPAFQSPQPVEVKPAAAEPEKKAAPASASPSPAAAKPAVARPAGGKLHLPVAQTAPPPTRSAQPQTRAKPPKPKPNTAQRVMMAIIALCLLAGVAVAWVAWARDRLGYDWNDRLAARWKEMFRGDPASSRATPPSPPAESPTPAKAPKSAAAKAATPKAATPKAAVPKAATSKAAAPKAADPKAPAVKIIAADKLDGSGDLQGRAEGSGWKGPWEAKLATLDKNRVLIGKGGASSASRTLDPASGLAEGYVTVGLLVAHPGKDAAPLKLDLLAPDAEALVAPVCVAFEDGKLVAYVDGAKEKLEVLPGKPFRLVASWNWKSKTPADKRDIQVSVAVFPPPLNTKQGAKPARSTRVLEGAKVPAEFRLVLQCDGGEEAVAVADLKLTR